MLLRSAPTTFLVLYQPYAFNLPYTSASETEEIYACHAAGIVAAANPNWLDELGDVRVEEMSMQWKAGHGTCLDSGPYSGD